MAGETIEVLLGTTLWRQFGAAIEMLENALQACPAVLWTERLWNVPAQSHFPSQFSEFWYVTYHTLVWLDIYLSGLPEEDFAPPAHFLQGELDSAEAIPERPYTKETLHSYLAALREKCHTQFIQMTEEQLGRSVRYPWSQGEPISYLELQLYSLRHVQEHAAHLSLFLGRQGISDANIDWAPKASGS